MATTMLMTSHHALAQVTVKGSVFGGGNEADVQTNTVVNISAGTVEGNVYGGGNLGDVGNIDKTDQTDYNYKWTVDENGTTTETYNNTGFCTVSITGGTVGVDGTVSTEKGNVFGAGKGKADSYWCEKGMVYKTGVSISKGKVYGNVYGGGQLGRVENNTVVTVEGTNDNDTEIKGDVFGAGAGVATHGYSALVRGDATVTIQGKAKVGKSVYGGGETASVGRFRVENSLPKEPLSGGTCTVTIGGDAKIGTGEGGGDVYGACKGVTPDYAHNAGHWMSDNQHHDFEGDNAEAEYLSFLKTLALTSNTIVTVGGTSSTVYGSVFGGGQRGITLGTVSVSMTGGTVNQDVYGGGALADTNTGNWNSDYGSVAGLTAGTSIVTGYYTRSGSGTNEDPYVYTQVTAAETKAAENTTYYSINSWSHATQKSALYTTTVNLTGGLIKGDAYGGGLGQKTNFNGATSNIAAVVWGDIAVTLDGTKFDINKYEDEGYTNVVKSGRVFGCNNLYGSPQGYVTVTVQKTVAGNSNRSETANKNNPNATYEVAAVYGGGNLADYTATGMNTHVIINGCSDTSIQYVYGGGNAAAVPETDVDINAAYEIEAVFGGGNGKDKYKADNGWQTNPGANVNVNANTMIYGGTIHEAFGGSNEKGTIFGSVSINTGTNADCTLNLGKLYGAGKNADIEGDLIVVMGCMPGDESKTDEVYGGAENANVKGNVELTITSGSFGKVFGGNNTSGAIFGHIILNIEESGCTPIKIDELYLGGYNAPYSIYGYYENGTIEGTDKPKYDPISANDNTHTAVCFGDGSSSDHTKAPYADPILNVISATYIGKVFGGGLGADAIIYGNPTVNINQTNPLQFASYNSETKVTTYSAKTGTLGSIGENGIFGGGNEAPVYGNTTVNIGNQTTVDWTVLVLDDSGQSVLDANNKPLIQTITGETFNTVLGANITGNVYGGGKLANVGYLDDDTKENDPNSVYCNTFVNIGAKEVTENNTKVWKSVVLGQGTAGVTILGNVYGGGEGEANASTYKCDKAMVVGNTNVRIGNGTVGTLDNNDKLVDGTGNVYGGGEIGRVEKNSTVTIGFETGTSSPNIKGSVYGAGSGVTTHGYSALVRGNSEVTVQGNAKVDGSVYGGGETASVGRYNIATTQALATQYNVEVGEPYSLISGGKSKVTIQGNAEIGPDDMKMTATDGPDDAGHVFGAGKGVLPYQNLGTEGAGRYYLVNDVITWEPYGESNEDDYEKYMLTLALSDNTDVTIAGSAFVKGSVYGGSENGHVRTNTLVKIEGGQIGAGYDKDTGESLSKYSDGQFIDPATTPVTTANALKTCAAWPYDKATTGKPYDMYEGTQSYDSKGGADAAHANDGHTFYGNVFGGGSGYYPYAPGKWLESAGSVGGNTEVRITAGHILSNVYGGNEQTNVEGSCTITMSGGTIGVPRTKEQIQDHPVVGSLFGAGKGDKRVLFNIWTNVASTSITINGGIVYGSVFGGGEDGHVMGNATTLIQEASGKTITIGSTGESGADGNVFGGGRGSETALTAGVVGGNVSLTINSGTIKGSVYGGGRLASVGTNFVNPDNIELYGKLQTPDADHGNITININDGTIGNTNSTGVSGNIYGGSKGTTSQFDLGIVRSTTINMTGGTAYASVYGGGELAQVVGSHTTSDQALGTEINISGGTIGTAKANLPEGTTYGATYGNVYGGGKGNTTHVEAGLIKTNTKVSISQASGKTTLIRHNIYGGGAYGSVGEFNYDGTTGMPTGRKENTTGGKATIVIDGGTIGEDGHENGMIFGSSRGDIGAPGEIHDKLAWVYDTEVTVNDGQIKGSIYGGGENGHVYHDAAVNVHGGTIGISEDPNYAYRGNVYGGGCGTDMYDSDDDGTEDSYNPLAGIVYGNATVLIDGGHVVHNVYGAGAMGSVGTDTSGGKTTVSISGGRIGYDGSNNGNVYGAARGDLTATGNLAQVRETEVNINYTTTPAADNEGKTVQLIAGSVFGGGEAGTVKGSVAVNMTGGLILKDIYGGGALADTQTSNWNATNNTWATGMVTNGKTTYKTTVNLLGGLVKGDAYGGGLGQKIGFNGGNSDIEATVYGDITVNLGTLGTAATNDSPAIPASATAFNVSYEDTDDKDDNNNYIQVVKSGRVFGCNNLNGSPQGDVTVNVYKTVAGNVERTVAENPTAPAQEQRASRDASVHTYELADVYGGGNLADYTASGKKASVIIHSCDVSVQYVYGGGNAAAVPETDVLVKGAWEIDHVFGGGNGKDKYKKGNAWIANDGANVNGNTNTLLIGGYIHEAYGGSNEKGTITGNVTINTNSEHEDCACALELVKLYGAGKNADIEGDLIVVLDCAPETKTAEIYGGAENANVKGNVELTITSGSFGKVFGGNNQSGAIFGHIILNVEETTCRPIIIDELYGCGNNAAYSVYGYKNGGTDYEGYPIYVPRTSKDDGTPVTFAELPHTVLNNTKPQYNDPELNIISCTSIGKVFGGGLGSGATVYGNPTVNIDQIYGKAYVDNDPTKAYTATATTLGVIGDVFGGGNEANVVGNTNVNIGTKNEVWLHQSVDANGNYTMYPADTTPGNGIPVVGANITGNVYGGGNEAEVTGDTNVTIGKSVTP